MPQPGQPMPAGPRLLDYVICDVFTEEPLAGNALAVFPSTTGLDAELRQCLARELNLSETVFVTAAEQGGDARLAIHTLPRSCPSPDTHSLAPRPSSPVALTPT